MGHLKNPVHNLIHHIESKSGSYSLFLTYVLVHLFKGREHQSKEQSKLLMYLIILLQNEVSNAVKH